MNHSWLLRNGLAYSELGADLLSLINGEFHRPANLHDVYFLNMEIHIS